MTRSAILSLVKAKRLLRKNAFAFTVTVKQTDLSVDANRDFNIRELFDDAGMTCVSGQGSVRQREIENLLDEYNDVFREPPPGLPRERKTVHTNPTVEGTRPPYRPPFRLRPAERTEVERQIKHLLEMGYVRPSTSPYGAPILFVPKPDGSLRMCVDYRMLNAVTKVDAYPLPTIGAVLDKMQGACYFSAIDLKNGFHAVGMDAAAQEKSAFCTTKGLYNWKRMSFGLVNASATFQRMMNLAMHGLNWEVCCCYIDDVLVFSRSFDEHLVRLEGSGSSVQAVRRGPASYKCQKV